jgi:deoxyribodipyrimidine photo-lyase
VKALGILPEDPRVRRVSYKPEASAGEYVLYWMQAFRRAEDNVALAYAIERANELGLPCLVYESLRPDYPYASDRLHAFALEGAKDTAARLAARGILHAFFLPRVPDEARGVVAKLAARAALVVSDDFPSFIVPEQNEAAAARAPCAYVAIDDCAIVPMALFPEPAASARVLRPKLLRALERWLQPIEEPAPRKGPPRLDLPFDPLDLAKADVDALVASCAIDHSVPRVTGAAGGTLAGEERLAGFLRSRLGTYAVDRSDPSRDATSELSPYLHWGMISARKVALSVRAEQRDAKDPEDGATAMLEQLVVRRALSFNFARNVHAHARYDAVPAWARASLESRSEDRAGADEAALEEARSSDELWNAAQNELRTRGTVQTYARMLWGKLVVSWMVDPARAHALLVRLNDRWALDGRDPNGYANISWCFGLHDRPFPERARFGAVRPMTSASARRKLDFESYIERWR